MSKKFKLGLTLFLLGMAGVLSMVTVTIAMPEAVTKTYSPEMLKLLTIIGPAIYLIITVSIGTALYDKTGLTVPSVSRLLKIETAGATFIQQIKSGTIYGIISGILIIIVGVVFKSSLPDSFVKLGEKITLTPLARLLYGGITEELLMRYGLMTLFVWVAFKITKKLSAGVYWTGIVLATLLFAVGHFPVVFTVVPNPSPMLLLYILLGNSVAGLIFGWLYWKKGLEAAMIAHMFAHIVMMAGEGIFKLQ
jgi:hypothetical protein